MSFPGSRHSPYPSEPQPHLPPLTLRSPPLPSAPLPSAPLRLPPSPHPLAIQGQDGHTDPEPDGIGLPELHSPDPAHHFTSCTPSPLPSPLLPSLSCRDKTGTLTQNQMAVVRLQAGGRVFTVTHYKRQGQAQAQAQAQGQEQGQGQGQQPQGDGLCVSRTHSVGDAGADTVADPFGAMQMASVISVDEVSGFRLAGYSASSADQDLGGSGVGSGSRSAASSFDAPRRAGGGAGALPSRLRVRGWG